MLEIFKGNNIITLRKPINIFYSVILAIFFREIQTRFSSQKLGYFWAIVDTASMIVVFSFIKVYMMDRALPGIDFPVFLATSFLAYNLFKAIVMKSMDAFEANRALYVYKQVKPIDTIFARVLVEFLVVAVVTVLLIGVGIYIGYDLTIQNFSMVIFAVFWFMFFGMGLGIFFAVIVNFFDNFKKIINLIFLPLFFLSGLFYTVESLPPQAREIILYNPIIHFIEMIHGNYFHALDTTYVNYEYMILWTLIPLFCGLWLYRKTEYKVIAS
jgi:capsular polysaccharide transport system permease protein